jgi:hypothetical protein
VGVAGCDGGVRYARATFREELRIARLALVTVIVARVIASTSAPTLNVSRMFFFSNCGESGSPRK